MGCYTYRDKAGIIYVSYSESYWDKILRKTKTRKIHLGHRGADGRNYLDDAWYQGHLGFREDQYQNLTSYRKDRKKYPEWFENGGIGRPPGTWTPGGDDVPNADPEADDDDADDVADADPHSQSPPQQVGQVEAEDGLNQGMSSAHLSNGVPDVAMQDAHSCAAQGTDGVAVGSESDTVSGMEADAVEDAASATDSRPRQGDTHGTITNAFRLSPFCAPYVMAIDGVPVRGDDGPVSTSETLCQTSGAESASVLVVPSGWRLVVVQRTGVRRTVHTIEVGRSWPCPMHGLTLGDGRALTAPPWQEPMGISPFSHPPLQIGVNGAICWGDACTDAGVWASHGLTTLDNRFHVCGDALRDVFSENARLNSDLAAARNLESAALERMQMVLSENRRLLTLNDTQSEYCRAITDALSELAKKSLRTAEEFGESPEHTFNILSGITIFNNEFTPSLVNTYQDAKYLLDRYTNIISNTDLARQIILRSKPEKLFYHDLQKISTNILRAVEKRQAASIADLYIGAFGSPNGHVTDCLLRINPTNFYTAYYKLLESKNINNDKIFMATIKSIMEYYPRLFDCGEILISVDDTYVLRVSDKAPEFVLFRSTSEKANRPTHMTGQNHVTLCITIKGREGGYFAIPVLDELVAAGKNKDETQSMIARRLLRKVVMEIRKYQPKARIICTADAAYMNKKFVDFQKDLGDIVYIGRIRSNSEIYRDYQGEPRCGRGRRPTYDPDKLTFDLVLAEYPQLRTILTTLDGMRKMDGEYYPVYKSKNTVYNEVRAYPELFDKRACALVLSHFERDDGSLTDPRWYICTDPNMAGEKILQRYTIRWPIETSYYVGKNTFRNMSDAWQQDSETLKTWLTITMASIATVTLLAALHPGVCRKHNPAPWRDGKRVTPGWMSQLLGRIFFDETPSLYWDPIGRKFNPPLIRERHYLSKKAS
jgi:hypothetical protein